MKVVVSMAFRKFSHGVRGHLAGTGFGALKAPFVSQRRERIIRGSGSKYIENPEWELRRKPWPPGCCLHHQLPGISPECWVLWGDTEGRGQIV